ncbi:hypothetical protein N7492_006193 [Penicillium capsulatum]|uniref:AB hydrolase-1 domain-containing protein n=1 Tax=Penicillium capsulatum TaxID=69766 RepID=A0A9W9LLW4_9EURO|nr:hypothetical protein N7492_006193 [Penicillium capsulatum]KAJ6108845.1 hypothetical protein N7512_008682 [Penicillium capsulatum]
MTPAPTLIFVHGAWHSPECLVHVLAALQQQGLRCLAPQLEFCGTEQPVESLAGSVHQVQDLIAAETSAGRNVLLINHSFGGCVGCSAVDGFTEKNPARLTPTSGKILGIVQVCAFMPPSKTALYDVLHDAFDMTKSFHHAHDDGWEWIDAAEPEDLFYNDLSPEQAQYWKSRLLKQSTSAMKDRDPIYAGWADCPVWYLLCTRDHAIPISAQEAMVAAAREAGASVTTKVVDAGHSPFLSKPDETVAFIAEAVEHFRGKSTL